MAATSTAQAPRSRPAGSPGTQRPARPALPALIDADIHVVPAPPDGLQPYLSARWRRHEELVGRRGFQFAAFPRAMPNAARHDAWPPNGGPPGSDLPFLQSQLMDTWDIDYGVLNPLTGVGQQRNLEYGAALARAVNDWQQAEWLERDPRLRGSVICAYESADLAVDEIARRGGDQRFVHILLVVRTAEPLGRRKYWPLYEAACSHDLPIAIHFGGAGGAPFTGAGWPSYYIEDHAGMAQAFQAQAISFACEGVFERFPELRVVFIEGGCAWLPPLLWRLDCAWRQLRDEVPLLQRPPSEYLREHLWLTTQPMEEPPRSEQFHQLLRQLDMNERLMFATDYPHWDFDSPRQALPGDLAPDLRAAILAGNAQQLYRLPDKRPGGAAS